MRSGVLPLRSGGSAIVWILWWVPLVGRRLSRLSLSNDLGSAITPGTCTQHVTSTPARQSKRAERRAAATRSQFSLLRGAGAGAGADAGAAGWVRCALLAAGAFVRSQVPVVASRQGHENGPSADSTVLRRPGRQVTERLTLPAPAAAMRFPFNHARRRPEFERASKQPENSAARWPRPAARHACSAG